MIALRNVHPKHVMEWFKANSAPETIRSQPHLQQWTGKGWIMKLRYEVGVVHFNLEIEFKDGELEHAFSSRCNSHDWSRYA